MSMESCAPGEDDGIGGVVRVPGTDVSQTKIGLDGCHRHGLTLTVVLAAKQAVGKECSPGSR